MTTEQTTAPAGEASDQGDVLWEAAGLPVDGELRIKRDELGLVVIETWSGEYSRWLCREDEDAVDLAAHLACLLRDSQAREAELANAINGEGGWSETVDAWRGEAEDWKQLAREAEARAAELQAKLDRIAPLHCPECGPNIAIDEDGCCGTCGADAFDPRDAARAAVKESP